MAISDKVGRPRRIADIDFRHDPEQELYDRFYAACRTLGWSEIWELAGALQVNLSTVKYWRLGKYFPATRGMAMHVIHWVERGKPTKMVTRVPSMFYKEDT